MSIIHFTLEDMDVEAPPGTAFADVVLASGADVTFGCRNGTCGTCRIRVEAPETHVSPVGPEERAFLEALEAGPGERLGCQLKILGDCRITYLGL
jgi:ferredoxin